MTQDDLNRGFGVNSVSTGHRFGPIRRELFLTSPRPGAGVIASTYYTRLQGPELISMHEVFSRSDTTDVAYFRHSADNGRTWADGERVITKEARPRGTLRRVLRTGFLDPASGRFLRFRMEGILKTDDPLEGMWEWVVYYSVSEDGGLTWCLDEEVIARGPEFNAAHPLPGVWTGRNGFMLGDLACKVIALADGTLLVPVIVTPTGPDGHYYNPGGGYTYSDAAVLRGRWAPDGRHLEWELSQRVAADPHLSTRGMDEPTVIELADGRILMVMRGSNDKKPSLPGRRWVAYSRDQGRTWTQPVPWTYANGGSFFSPAVSSSLFQHSSGRIFWFGDIVPVNPTGNRPRYPLVVGEVNGRSGLLEADSVQVIDDRGRDDSVQLQLTSPSVREDRATGELVVNLSRYGANSKGDTFDFTTNAYLYRLSLI